MANCCVTASAAARLRTPAGREPPAGLYVPTDDQILPSNLSSAVMRQYSGAELCTLNSSLSDWSTSRVRMSTRGLIVVRELGPLSRLRQLKTGVDPAPGRSGPKVTATITAIAPTTRPRPTSALLPGPRRPASQFAVSSRRAAPTNSTNSSTDARYSAAIARRLRLKASTEPNRNIVNEGMTLSKVASTRKAAVSAMNAQIHAAIADATMNPRVTGAGGTTLLNRLRAPDRSLLTAVHVLARGRPPVSVCGSMTYAMTS